MCALDVTTSPWQPEQFISSMIFNKDDIGNPEYKSRVFNVVKYTNCAAAKTT